MATFYYLNISLILSFLFIIPISKNMKNAQDQELHQAVQSNIQKIKAIQKHCKENNIDLKTVLSEKELKQFLADINYLKIIAPEIKNNLLEINVPSIEGDPNNIGKGEFVKVASLILKELIQAKDPFNILDANLINNGAYTINSVELAKKLSSLKPDTPLGIKFMEFFQNNISACTTVNKTKKVLDAIINKLNDKSYLLKHYVSNQDKYNQSNSSDELGLSEIFASSLRGDFGNLQHSIKTCVANAIDDPSFSLNKETKEKEELKKEKEELERKEFQKAFAAWKAKQDEICSSIISHDTKTDSVCSMSKAAFFTALVEVSNDWQKSQPLLAKELRINIMAEIKEDAQVKDFVNAMSKALLSINTPENYIYRNWQKSQVMPSFSALKTAIITSTDGTSPYNFIGEYVEWAAGVSGALDSLKLPLRQQFIMDKLLTEFDKLLSKKELNFFYPTFESKIKKIADKYPSLREVSEAWQTTLYEVAIKSDSVKLHYDALSHSEKQNINNISDTLNTIASLDTIKAAFIASKKPSVKSQKLAKGENLNLTIELENGTILNHTIQTQIVKIDGRACAVPTDISLAASNKDGYTFQQKNFYAKDPTDLEGKGFDTDFEFEILFSKNKGTIMKGTESGSEFSAEGGGEKSKTDVDIDVTNNTWTAEGSVFVVTGDYSHEDGHEVGTEETTSTFHSIGYAQSSSDTKEKTLDKGIETGFILVKAYIHSYDYDPSGTFMVNVEIQTKGITSPNFKGQIPKKTTTTQKERLRWAK